jgi:hypothetical protein
VHTINNNNECGVCVINNNNKVVRAQLTTSIACAQSTTTSSECTPINDNNNNKDVSVLQDATAHSTTSSAYNYVSASFFGLSSFLLYKNFFCKNKISFLYIKVALKVNSIRR